MVNSLPGRDLLRSVEFETDILGMFRSPPLVAAVRSIVRGGV